MFVYPVSRSLSARVYTGGRLGQACRQAELYISFYCFFAREGIYSSQVSSFHTPFARTCKGGSFVGRLHTRQRWHLYGLRGTGS